MLLRANVCIWIINQDIGVFIAPYYMLKHLDEQPDPVMTKTKPRTKRRSKAQKLSLSAAHAAQTLNSKLKIAEGSINLQLTRASTPLLELQSTQKQLVETIATLIAKKKWTLEAIGHANQIKIYSKLLQDQVQSQICSVRLPGEVYLYLLASPKQTTKESSCSSIQICYSCSAQYHGVIQSS